MKAFVTGATGFIGSHLVEALVQQGAQVRCLVRNTSPLGWMKDLPVEFVVGDCRDQQSLRQAVQDVDLVFHLAGATMAVKEQTFFEVNGLGTQNLVQACIENKTRLKKFIYLSSQAAAGPCLSDGKKQESDPCEPVSPYGKSKLLGEQLALSQAHELPLLILRPCAVYGPRDKGFLTVFKCLSKNIKPCLADHDQYISMCYVEDLVRAMLLAAGTPTESGEIFFVSDGHDYRMEEIGDIFEQALEKRALKLRLPQQLLPGVGFIAECFAKVTGKPSIMSRGKVREIRCKNWLCDITKARVILGFEPRIALARGSALTAAWYRKENWL
ncbi:NAD(P)-dependent oxidoreductase [Desulfobulbus sp.]|uniref:NAD-dependent epimerase/dehydratase family protein n=1 Tax=Desulfobulbus sp. TaxID=895 RepID=UPI0027BA64DD|nr:NAD-dependent epimerase/dehydratase family protein [Desulfobulbus sp.]